MIFWITNTLVVFFLSVIFSGFIIPQILLIAARKQLYDVPDERKIHTCAVPRLGGIAFEPVVFFSVAIVVGLNLALGKFEILYGVVSELQQIIFGYCSIIVLYLVGIADDLIGVRYRAKFIAQIVCAVMLILGGLYFDNLHGILGINQLPLWFAYPFTVLIVVFIINAINLIDGIDGLASGLCSVAFLFFGLIFFHLNEYIFGLLSFATLGVLLPFFYYNVFGNPDRGRKIFMGDTGSLTIGIMICFMSLKLMQTSTLNEPNSFNPFVMAFAPLIIPCFDVVRVYLHRVKNGKNPFLPDKNHIHHKLLAVGINQRQAMISIIVASILLTVCNICLSTYIDVNWLLLGNLLLWTVFNIVLTNKIMIHTEK